MGLKVHYRDFWHKGKVIGAWVEGGAGVDGGSVGEGPKGSGEAEEVGRGEGLEEHSGWGLGVS